MALIDVDADPWLHELEGCEKLYEDIHKQLATRSREPDKTSQNYARISANIRLRLKQYSTEVMQLKDKLKEDSSRMTITSEEAERRDRQVETLESRAIQLQNQFDGRTVKAGSSGPSTRNRLFMGSQGQSYGDSDEEPIDAQDMSVEDIRTQMRKIEQDQDHGLDALSKVISRQKQIAETIGGEVDLQNDILDELGDQIDRTDTNISRETRQVSFISRKDNTCAFWIVIIALLIAIVIVWIV